MFKSSILVTLLSLVLSIIGFISQMLIAGYFGAGHSLDLYLTISSLPLLCSAIISSALSYSLTPVLIDARLKFSDNFNSFIGYFLKKLFVFNLIIACAGAVIIYFLLPVLYPSIKAVEYDNAFNILFTSWATFPFAVITGFFASQFNSSKQFIKPLLLSFLPYFFSIFFILTFHSRLGIVSIPLGLLIGNFLAATCGFFLLKNEISFLSTGLIVKAAVNKFLVKIPVVAIAMLCFTIYQSIDAYWAPKLGPSNLSYLGYCQRLLIAVGALVITGPSTVLIPRLTQSILENRKEDFLNDANLIIKIIFSLASLIALIGSILSFEIIDVMFVRGKFSIDNALSVASILPYMLTGMIFMLCVVVMFRMLYVQNKSNFVSFIGVSSVLIYFTLSGLAVYYADIRGICLAYIITWFILFAFCLNKIFYATKSSIFNRDTMLFLAKTIMVNLIIGIFLHLVRLSLISNINLSSKANSFFIITVCGLLGVIMYLILTMKLFIISELNFFYKKIFQLISKS